MQAQVAGFKLSSQQSRIWLAQAEHAPITQSVWRVARKLDAQRVRAAFDKAVSHHEVLRTTYPAQPGMKVPFQVVRPTLAMEWTTSAWTGESALDASAQEARRAFDLVNGPLLRVALLQDEANSVLVITAPAITLDPASSALLVAEVARLYAGESLDETLQYADYSEWNNSLADNEDEEAQQAKQFWSDLEGRSLRSPELPLEYRERKGHESAQSIKIELEKTAQESLLQRAAAASSDIGAILLAAWAAYVRRLGTQSQVVINNVFDGRTVEEAKTSLGAFARPLPIVAEIDLASKLDAVVASIRPGIAEAQRWQDHGTRLVVSGASVEFEFLRPTPATFEGAAARLTSISHEPSTSKAKLLGWQQDTGVSLMLQYDPSRMAARDAGRLAENFGNFLNALAADANAALGRVPTLGAQEKENLVATFNRTATDFGVLKPIHVLFEEQVSKTPDAPAVADASGSLTFAELNTRANQVAQWLRKSGVTSNVPVAVLLPRTGDSILAILGVMKAGGAYVPLVPDNPKSRLAHQIAETAAPFVITNETLRGTLPEMKAQVLSLDGDRDRLNAEPKANLDVVNQLDDLVYVIYTSGSTGTPKGVGVRHRNLANYAASIRRMLGIEAGSCAWNFAVVSTIAADLGNTCIFPSLTSGGCLHVVDYETAMNASSFGAYCAKHPIDVLKITPSHLNALLALPGGERVLPQKFLFLGGDAASWELLRRVRSGSGCQIINHYGPTETTVGSLTYRLPADRSEHEYAAKVPIGAPIGNTRVYILDEFGALAPTGVPGELHIAGSGVASGYLRQDAQTQERFVQEFGTTDTSRKMYRTGDLTRWLPDGTVEFLGRVDHQVKIRGFRVEPGEIEACLAKLPGVHQAVVIAFDEASGDKKLVAYVVLKTASPSSEALRNALAERLPDYMVPSAFVFLPEFPLTTNGKVDRNALPSPDQTAHAAASAYVAPRNPVEEQIAQIWMQVLKMERVSVEDNFFAIGGHSLLATQVISRMQSAFHVQVPLRAIFESSTVAGLAARVNELAPHRADDAELANVLGELENLSDEEAERLLAMEGDGQDAN